MNIQDYPKICVVLPNKVKEIPYVNVCIIKSSINESLDEFIPKT